MDLQYILNSTEISFETAVVRLAVSFLAGLLVGIEREAHSQPAGMRTHILISIGSTMAMLLSIYIPQTYPGFQGGDPGRIAAQVVTGIGFLGAGAILRFGVNVKGLTTAASIWSMAMLGLAIGAGLFAISAVAVAIILFSLTVMDLFEKHFFRDKILKKIEITALKKGTDPASIQQELCSLRIRVHTADIRENNQDDTTKYTIYAYIPVHLDLIKLRETIGTREGVVAFSVEMMN